jgi:hypothetical protein
VFAPDVHREDFHLDTSEIAEVRFIAYNEVNLDDLAFDSTRHAVQACLNKKVSDTVAGTAIPKVSDTTAPKKKT